MKMIKMKMIKMNKMKIMKVKIHNNHHNKVIHKKQYNNL